MSNKLDFYATVTFLFVFLSLITRFPLKMVSLLVIEVHYNDTLTDYVQKY